MTSAVFHAIGDLAIRTHRRFCTRTAVLVTRVVTLVSLGATWAILLWPFR